MSTAAYRDIAREDRERRVMRLRVTDDFGTFVDSVFWADPSRTVALADLKRQFRTESADEFSSPDYRSAYSPAALGRMARALDGDDAFAEDGDVLGTYRIVNHGGRPMLRLDLPVTAATQRKRDYRARSRDAQSADALAGLSDWLSARKAARSEPEEIGDTLAAFEDEHGQLSDDDYLTAETYIDDRFPEWEAVA